MKSYLRSNVEIGNSKDSESVLLSLAELKQVRLRIVFMYDIVTF
jgi:hypothetical protein